MMKPRIKKGNAWKIRDEVKVKITCWKNGFISQVPIKIIHSGQMGEKTSR